VVESNCKQANQLFYVGSETNMQGKLKYHLNTEEFYRLCGERRWTVQKFVEEAPITRQQMLAYALPIGNQKHQTVTQKSMDKFKKTFRLSEDGMKRLFFLSSELQARNQEGL
jgi:hypothetical protein